MSYNSWPARRHVSGTLQASEAAAIAAAADFCVSINYENPAIFRYKAIYFNTAGVLDVVDASGTKLSVTTVAGSMYPLQNCGAVTGGNTTLTNGQFILLYD